MVLFFPLLEEAMEEEEEKEEVLRRGWGGVDRSYGTMDRKPTMGIQRPFYGRFEPCYRCPDLSKITKVWDLARCRRQTVYTKT
ncbi:hypothetical protein PoB_003730100 [Plakobranchus ocellatus]|uniref:Uncharacterized protein n=1 Tax=Plakobranchus ocellatus TaxID=259542 RepID=A0AAV4AHZ7_9GAST|nr:hypothetical protein PoB_003730100 [Plakobranchus ocellatus]